MQPPSKNPSSNKLVLEPSKACLIVSHLRRELRRHQLTLREILVAEIIVDHSYGWGLRSLRVPGLEDFTDLCGIDRPNIHRTLQSLEDMCIIVRQELDGSIIYKIQPDAAGWKVRVRVFPATVRRAEEKLRALNALTIETEALPIKKCAECPANFRDCPSAVIFGCHVDNSSTVAFPKVG